MKVTKISITRSCVDGLDENNPEQLITYCARVSNPDNQTNTETSAKLLQYLIKHKHWSPFELVDVTFKIVTTRAIAAQILRHRSFSFQEFSQRYSIATEVDPIELRNQAISNRQSSSDVMDNPHLSTKIESYIEQSLALYDELIASGVAREVARGVLPLNTQTTLYMKGSIRSWLSYLNVRLDEGTQKEHRLIAQEIAEILALEFPNVTEATNNFNDYTGNFM